MLLKLDHPIGQRRPPLWAGILTACALAGLMAYLWLSLTGSRFLPVGYGVPLVIIALFRSRRLLWATALTFALITLLKLHWVSSNPMKEDLRQQQYNLWIAGMVLLDLLVVTSIAHIWISTAYRLNRRNIELETSNADLAAREEEIARQNEELQSQAEELERQSEELRVTNDELARRERTLEVLLTLSRSLTTDLTSGDTMSKICETLSLLVNSSTAASAILEQKGNQVVVKCHHGFGPEGMENSSIPLESSFASLVLTRGRTGYLDDISLRPDLRIPQPRSGEPLRCVLASPLRVGGWPIGTLEVYSHQPCSWTDEQIALVESLAAQTSVSMEAAQLFDSINQERRRFETVLKTVAFGIAVANEDGSEIHLNPAGALMFNLPVDANLADRSVLAGWQIFKDGKPMVMEQAPLFRALHDAQETRSTELEMISDSGRHLVLLVNAAPIRDKSDRVVGAVAAFADITPQKDLQRELDSRRREAEEASVRKTRFLAAVSHDIRTPANAISLLAELIRRTAANPALITEVPELARELHGSSMSLVNLLSDVLDVARFDSGTVGIQESEFPVGELLAEEYRRMLPLAREKGLTMEVQAPEGPLWLRSDRIKLSRVIGNLVGNAIKFTEKGSVRIEGRRMEDGRAQIRVTDTGVGIAPEHQAHIFDEFFQLRNPERDRNKGSGLGLTICKRLVDAMGGELSVQSTPGQGSTFMVTIPTLDGIGSSLPG